MFQRGTFHSISKVVILGLRLARGKYHYGRFWMRLGLVALLGLLAIDDTVVIPCPPELWARSAITSLSNNHAQNWWKMIIEQHLQRRSRLSWHQHEPKWCHENSWKTLGEASTPTFIANRSRGGAKSSNSSKGPNEAQMDSRFFFSTKLD